MSNVAQPEPVYCQNRLRNSGGMKFVYNLYYPESWSTFFLTIGRLESNQLRNNTEKMENNIIYNIDYRYMLT